MDTCHMTHWHVCSVCNRQGTSIKADLTQFSATVTGMCVVCCSVLQCVAVCCSYLTIKAEVSHAFGFCHGYVLQCVAVCCSVLQCVVACCSVLQRVAVCCNVLQCVVACCNVL